MNLSEFKKFFNLDYEFEKQKKQNDIRLKMFIKKGKRSLFGLGILSTILLFTLTSISYDNKFKIKHYFYLKLKILHYKLMFFSHHRQKINFLLEILSSNVKFIN